MTELPDELIICVRKKDDPGTFDDNVERRCLTCGMPVIVRPYMPAHIECVCLDCATTLPEFGPGSEP